MPSNRISTFLLAIVLGALATAYACVNFYPVWLTIDVASSDSSDQAQLFYSATGAWNEQESLKVPLTNPIEQLNLRIPAGSVGSGVRFDPGQRASEYHILSVRWQRGTMTRQLKPEMISNLRPDGQQLRVDGARVLLASSDVDAQVFLPAPGRPWRLLALWPLLLVAAVALAVAGLAWRERCGAVDVATIYLFVALGIYCLAAATYMPDLPLQDDWRYIMPGAFQITGDSYRWLTIVSNDTYYLTGQLLDYAVLKFSNGSFALLRWTGVGVLVVYLLAMRRSIVAAAGPTLGAAVGIALVAGVLGQPNYWGQTGVAYHQFIPVAVTALLLAYVGRYVERAGVAASSAILLLLCLLAGLAYISGGLMLACVGGGLLLGYADRRFDPRVPAVRAGLTILIAGIALLLLQVWLVSKAQGSLAEHNHAVGSVYPSDRRFPIFVVALFGRAAGYLGTNIAIDLGLFALCLSPGIVLGLERLWRGLVRGVPAQRPLQTALPIAAAAASLSYATAIAFGRAGFTTPDLDQNVITAIAKARFHFCTIAALLPLLWLGWVELAQRWNERQRGSLGYAAATVVALVFVLPKSLLPWKSVEELRANREHLSEGAYCAIAKFSNPSDTQPIICEGLTGVKLDLRATLQETRARHSRVYGDLLENTAAIGAPQP
ncbi:hypothetical protein ACFJIW_23900 [Tahibacter sp. UC22_41]|uniref:hypothetical protein n=1 Tax=Tahibacter sp. UC22_41 TaxID=3350178 RepID=UPI0036DC6D11